MHYKYIRVPQTGGGKRYLRHHAGTFDPLQLAGISLNGTDGNGCPLDILETSGAFA
jgi:hypothetical protein